MNLYVVTEGKVEAKVYRYWIPQINDRLTSIDYLSEVQRDNFLIVSANGYPDYFEVIENAIADVNTSQVFDRLVICVDSEELTKEEKFREIEDFLSDKHCISQIITVIQHFCFETWALGNRKIIRPNTTSSKLRDYRALFDVRTLDPELLPNNPGESLNRVKFAEKYLRVALNDKFKNLTYTKRNPKALLHTKYYEQVNRRFEETSHIASFENFIAAFV